MKHSEIIKMMTFGSFVCCLPLGFAWLSTKYPEHSAIHAFCFLFVVCPCIMIIYKLIFNSNETNN